ncbi:MAG: hypothetical protein R8G66_35125 [Cytophagales bacterium]|nr:hypothetical protein [Cytophagales bacterium]
MKQFRIILILFTMILVVLFSVQNAESVELRFVGFSGEISKTILMLLCFATGSVMTLVSLLPSLVRRRKNPKENQSSDKLSEPASDYE